MFAPSQVELPVDNDACYSSFSETDDEHAGPRTATAAINAHDWLGWLGRPLLVQQLHSPEELAASELAAAAGQSALGTPSRHLDSHQAVHRGSRRRLGVERMHPKDTCPAGKLVHDTVCDRLSCISGKHHQLQSLHIVPEHV